MEVGVWLALFVVTAIRVGVVQPAYIPGDRTVSDDTVICPDGCLCDLDDKLTRCALPYKPQTLEQLKVWQVTHLSLYQGDQETTVASFPGNTISFQDFQSLQYLHIDGISITAIDQSTFSDNGELMSIRLVQCSVLYISEGTFTGQFHLLSLNLSGNAIASLPKDAFHDLVRLQTLDLSKNHLTSLSEDIFSHLRVLEELDLSWNMLQTLAGDIFSYQYLPALRVLSLKGNDILYIDNLIQNMSSIQSLDVSSNNIQYIRPDSVHTLTNMKRILVSRNPFQCTCLLQNFIAAVQDNQFGDGQFTCYGPGSNLIGVDFKQLNFSELPCNAPSVSLISEPSSILYQSSLHLHCQVTGTPPLGLYWTTPWGDTFAHPDYQRLLPDKIIGTQSNGHYRGVNLDLVSTVYASADGSLHIDKFRGYFAGEFKCVSVSMLGTANNSVAVQVKTNITSIYITSLYVSGISAGAMMVLGLVIGVIRYLVSKYCHEKGCSCCCCCSDDDLKIEGERKEEIEDKDEEEEEEFSYMDDDDFSSGDFYDNNPPPKVPVNSPLFRTPRMSPKKCPTPSGDSDTEKALPSYIWETLEEAKDRLKYGAERKIQSVRSHVRSITSTVTVKGKRIKESGSLKIQSMKETGSHAASLVKNSVASGMETVKYGVMSIKEFCGTGEMGTGTVSMMSISTDVDTKEQVKIVKSHTFV